MHNNSGTLTGLSFGLIAAILNSYCRPLGNLCQVDELSSGVE